MESPTTAYRKRIACGAPQPDRQSETSLVQVWGVVRADFGGR
jgi:hypothetical protein